MKNLDNKKYVFNIIQEYIANKYDKNISLKTNLFVDLGLSEFEKNVFFEWVEQRFNIKLPYFYFKDINSLCVAINSVLNKTTIFQKIKNLFVNAK